MANKKKIVTPKMIKQAEELAGIGLNKSQIAYKLGMGKTTLYDMLKEDEELSEAIKRGSVEAIGNVTNALYNTAIEGNTSAQIFFLKNRAGWRDKTETEITGEMKVNEIKVVFK